jgi:hypothetical protein
MSSRGYVIAGLTVLAVLAAIGLWPGWQDDAERPDGLRTNEPPTFTTETGSIAASTGESTPPAQKAGGPCPPAATSGPVDVEQAIADYERGMQDVRDRLAASPDPEHRQAAALVERDPQKRIELLHRAMEQGRDNAFLLWHAVRICAKESAQTDCPLEAWETRLLALDGQNSEAWMLAATNRWRAGDSVAALRALRRAATAPVTRSYWPESVALLERAFAVGDMPFEDRAGSAFGAAAMNMRDYGSTTRMCRTQSAISREWADACLAYGELAERQGRTMLETAIARAIQKIAIEALGDEERLAAVIARQDQFKRQQADQLSTPFLQSGTAAVSDAKFFARYLDSIGEKGEHAAMEQIAQEWEAWRRQQGAADCDP